MAGSINKVILVGNVGKDPEVRRINENSIVANLSLATSETYTDKQGKKIENTEWHSLEFWGGMAETVEKFVRKGQKLYVEGKIRTRTWMDDQQNLKSKIEIRVDQMVMMSRSETTTSSIPPYEKKIDVNDGLKQSDLPKISGSEETDDLPF
jgi:single-strand DNA-binding protein